MKLRGVGFGGYEIGPLIIQPDILQKVMPRHETSTDDVGRIKSIFTNKLNGDIYIYGIRFCKINKGSRRM